MKIEAFGFDFDHTLGIDNKLERVAFLRLLDELCASGGHALGTLAEESARIDRLLQEQRCGRFSIETAVERFVVERGIREARDYVDRYKRIALESVNAFVVADPGTAQLLDTLRDRGVPSAILTNGWSPLQERKAARIAFTGPVVVSAVLGVQKPQAAAFEALADVLGVPKERIAYVGDNPKDDVGAAIAAGMAGIWFDAEGLPYPRDTVPPSAVIHGLAELPGLL